MPPLFIWGLSKTFINLLRNISNLIISPRSINLENTLQKVDFTVKEIDELLEKIN